MKTLITGHRGFVGTQFWRVLDDAGHDLTGIDIVEGNDARDFFRTNDTRFDLVIHLAAVVGGRLTIEGAPLSIAVDLSIDAEMFQWALRTKPGRVIYYSSSAAYPISMQGRLSTYQLAEDHINLDHVDNPDMTYGWAKLTGEYVAKFAQAEGLRVHIFRPFSGYGETQSLDYPFPSFIQRGARQDDPFEVWGDGTQVRDFMHIDDIVAATLKAVDEDVPGPVNLGTGRAISFNGLARMVMKEAGYSADIKHQPAKPTGVHYRVCDPYKMEQFYKPRISLEEGIARALKQEMT
jgi:nucleoside-diphosphate-sugar epimerase